MSENCRFYNLEGTTALVCQNCAADSFCREPINFSIITDRSCELCGVMPGEVIESQIFQHWIDIYGIESVVLSGTFRPLVNGAQAKLCCEVKSISSLDALEEIGALHRSLASMAGEEIFGIGLFSNKQRDSCLTNISLDR